VLVCAPDQEQAVRAAVAEPVYTLGHLAKGTRNVRFS
jgi:hypothetical protein